MQFKIFIHIYEMEQHGIFIFICVCNFLQISVRFTVICVNFTCTNTFIFFQVRFIDQLLIWNNLGKINRVVIILKSGFSPSFQWQLLDIRHRFCEIKLKIPQPRLPHSSMYRIIGTKRSELLNVTKCAINFRTKL